ncbi:MAG: TIGR00159 family protein [Syntrophomonadaceae bacterium]|nr:TIGR00159 family protein [Syntrophomonadaceae bacterium]
MLAWIQSWLPTGPADLFSFRIFVVILDITLVAFLLYKVLMFIRGTRGMQLLKGLIVLILFSGLSNWLRLETVAWILDKMWASLFVAVPVVFQPELRRALEQIGRGRFFTRASTYLKEEERYRLIREIIKAVQSFAQTKTGALIVIERRTGLQDYVEGAIRIDGLVSAEFLGNIFEPKTPLHDGAIIIRRDRIVAAGCLLPLSDSPYLSKDLGTRHRAAIGVTENTDAVAIVVSEETGIISLAIDGRLLRYLDEKLLKEQLETLLQPETPSTGFRSWRRSHE